MKFSLYIFLFVMGALLAVAGPVEELTQKADAGDVDAQMRLGCIYYDGDGVAKDYEMAAKWFLKVADQGDPNSQFNIGIMYYRGEGYAKDATIAAQWFLKAARNGNIDAQRGLGELYRNGDGLGKDNAAAFYWYAKAAGQDDPLSQFEIGLMYLNGEGIGKDYDSALNWFIKAANQGESHAYYAIGIIYYKGQGRAKNTREAAKWLLKAAEQGNPQAQCTLGVMYHDGNGVLKDEIESLAWFNVCSISGLDFAINARDTIERSIGRSASLAAQQRSKEILAKIEQNTSRDKKDNASGNDSSKFKVSTFKASGSGSLVTSTGYILTAAHVVADGTRFSVKTSRGINSAVVVRIDASNDLAILKISGDSFPFLRIMPSRMIRLGQSVATIGFPNIRIQGFSPKVTKGEISSLNGIGDDPRSWQISVPVQPGNSGGPLLDENGNLIGVIVSKLGLKAAEFTRDLPQNVAYAVKSSYALALLDPYLDSSSLASQNSNVKVNFEDMVANAQQSSVLILVY